MFLVSVKPRLMLVFISVTLGMLVEAFKRVEKGLKSDYFHRLFKVVSKNPCTLMFICSIIFSVIYPSAHVI